MHWYIVFDKGSQNAELLEGALFLSQGPHIHRILGIRDPYIESYKNGDPGPQFHIIMGIRGPQNGGSPSLHDTGPPGQNLVWRLTILEFSKKR